MEWIIIITVTALCCFVGYMRQQRSIEEGKTIKRSIGFYHEASEFTLKSISTNHMVEQINKLPCSSIGVNMKGNTRRIVFTTSNFEAELVKKPSEPDKMVYQFQFTHWKGSGGAANGVQRMNMLLTSIEKMFLEIDSATKIRTWKLETKSKMKFF